MPFVGIEKLSNTQKKWQFVLKNELNDQRLTLTLLHTLTNTISFLKKKCDSCCVLWLVCFYDILLMATSISSHIWERKKAGKTFHSFLLVQKHQLESRRYVHLWKIINVNQLIESMNQLPCSQLIEIVFSHWNPQFYARSFTYDHFTHDHQFLGELDFIRHHCAQFTRASLLIMTCVLYSFPLFLHSITINSAICFVEHISVCLHVSRFVLVSSHSTLAMNKLILSW